MMSSHPPATGAAAVDRFALFGNPPLLPGEDAAAYQELRERLCAALKPADVIDDIFVNDIMFWQWEVMRWRSFKAQLLGNLERALGGYLAERLRHEHYVDILKDKLVDAFLDCRLGISRDECIDMVQGIDPRQPAYDQNVESWMPEWFLNAGRHYHSIVDDAKAEKAAELAHQCRTEGPQSLPKLLAMVGTAVEEFTASGLEGLYNSPDSMLERVDQRLATIETRRDRVLRELERHKLAWGEFMRQTLKDIEPPPEVLDLPQGSAPSIAPPAAVA